MNNKHSEIERENYFSFPLVSIITATYNHEKYISPCIESVLAQTYQNWEQIIIDDSSTDSTQDIVGSYDDPRIRYHRQDHLGVEGLAVTYNKALKMATGQILAILEGDDLWPPDKLQKQVPSFDNAQVVLSWGKGHRINEDGHVLGLMKLKGYRLPQKVIANKPPGKALPALLAVNFLVPSSTVMLRKSALLKIGGFYQEPGTVWVDHSTWLRLALEGEFALVDHILGNWRQHTGQVSSRWTISSRQSFINELAKEQGNKIAALGLSEIVTALEHWVQARKLIIRGHNKQAVFHLKSAIASGYSPIRIKALLFLLPTILCPRLLRRYLLKKGFIA